MGNYGGVPASGILRVVLAMIIIVIILAFLAAIGMTDTVSQVTQSQLEVLEGKAIVNQEVEQWQIERPYYEQLLGADYAAAIAESEQRKLLIEAETDTYIAGLYDQRQVALAEYQQALVRADRMNLVGTILMGTAGVVAVVVVGIIAVVVIYRSVNRTPVEAAVPVQIQNDLWNDPVERRKRIDELREMDERERARLIRSARQPGYQNGRIPHPRRVPPSKN